MPKYSVKTYNDISPLGLAQLPAKTYGVGAEVNNPDAIVLRSFKLNDALGRPRPNHRNNNQLNCEVRCVEHYFVTRLSFVSKNLLSNCVFDGFL